MSVSLLHATLFRFRRLVSPVLKSEPKPIMNCKLNSLKENVMGEFIGDYYQGDTRISKYSSYEDRFRV